MSPAADTQKSSSKSGKLGGKEFEETFKPKSRDNVDENDIEDKKGKKGKKGKKDKKKKSGFRKIILILMIFIVLVVGAGAALYFSGNLNTIFETVGLTKPPAEITIEQKQAALDQREAALNEREQGLNDRQTQLDTQQKAFDDAQSAASASADANKPFEEILAGFSEEKLAELKQVGSIYSKMDATAAAVIMTKIYDDKQLAVIVYYMQPAASALVLAKLDPALAAGVTQILTN